MWAKTYFTWGNNCVWMWDLWHSNMVAPINYTRNQWEIPLDHCNCVGGKSQTAFCCRRCHQFRGCFEGNLAGLWVGLVLAVLLLKTSCGGCFIVLSAGYISQSGRLVLSNDVELGVCPHAWHKPRLICVCLSGTACHIVTLYWHFTPPSGSVHDLGCVFCRWSRFHYLPSFPYFSRSQSSFPTSQPHKISPFTVLLPQLP